MLVILSEERECELVAGIKWISVVRIDMTLELCFRVENVLATAE